MAFLKFSRDKRGYENFYLLQPAVRGKSRPRLLYWFRTPPNVKVGRTTPFDPDVRRALEAQNPDVAFDWTAIVQTPIPPADTERWRERRRFERAMRSASESENGEETESAQEGPAPQRPMELDTAPLITVATTEVLTVPPAEPEPNPATEAAAASNLSAVSELPGGGPAHRRRRRRRGRRRGPGSNVPGSNVPGSSVPGSETKETAGPESPHIDSTANEPDEPDEPDDENLEP